MAGPRSVYHEKEPRKKKGQSDQCRKLPTPAFPDHRLRTFARTPATKSAGSSDKDRRLVLKDNGTSFLVLGRHLDRYSRGLALVEDFNNPAPTCEPMYTGGSPHNIARTTGELSRTEPR